MRVTDTYAQWPLFFPCSDLHPTNNESVAASELTVLAIWLKQQKSLLESTQGIGSGTLALKP